MRRLETSIYASFDDYMNRALNCATRRKLRKKFLATEQAPPIQMSIVADVTSVIAQGYPLYLQVYQRSKLRAGASHAGQGSIFPLAPEREDRRVRDEHDP